MSQRTERVDELLRQEIGAILAKEVADPRIGFATITDVETVARPAPCQGLGQRDRPAGASGRDAARARPRHALRPPRAGPAAADPAHPGAARPARRLRRARHPRAAPAPRARGGHGPRRDRAARRVAAHARPAAAARGRRRRPARSTSPAGGRRGRRAGRREATAPAGARPRRTGRATRRARGRAAAAEADDDAGHGIDLAELAARVGAAGRSMRAPPRRATRARGQPREPGRRHARRRHRRLPRSSRRSAATATARLHATRCPPLTRSCAAWSASARTRTRPRRTTCWCSRTARPPSASGAVATGTRSCSRRCPGSSIDHHASQRRRGRRPTGSTPTRPPRARWWRSWLSGSACRWTLADGALADALMAGHRHGHGHLRPPERHARGRSRSRRRWSRPARRSSDISRRLYRTKPDAQLRLFGRVLDRLADVAGRPRHLVDAARRRTSPTTGAMPAHSEGIIDLLAQSEAAEVAMLFKEQADGTTRLSVRTKPGGVDATALTGAFGGGGHARAAGATVHCRSTRRPRRSLARSRAAGGGRSRADEAPRDRQRRARRRPRRGEAVGPDVARRRGARPAAVVHPPGRPWRHARPVRGRRPAGVPRSGDPSRRVPPRRPQALSRDRLLRGDLDDRRHRRRADADRGTRRSTREARRGGARGLHAARSARSRRPTARCRSSGRRAYRWPAPASRSELAPREVVIHALDLLEWDAADPARPIGRRGRRVLGGHVHPRTRPGSRRAPRDGAYLGALVRTASRRLRTRRRDPARRRCAQRAAEGPTGIARVLRPIDAGLEDAAARAVTADEVRRLGEGLITAPRTPLAVRDAPLVLAVGPDGAVVAVCRAVAGALYPHKVLAARPRDRSPGPSHRHVRRRWSPPDRCASPAASTASRARHDAAFVVVGVFDGLHLGPRVPARAPRRRRPPARDARPMVITFDHHPDEILTGSAPPLLCDPDERLERLAAAGVDDDRRRPLRPGACARRPYDAFVGHDRGPRRRWPAS